MSVVAAVDPVGSAVPSASASDAVSPVDQPQILNRQFIFPVQSVELSLNFLSRLNIFFAQVVATSKLTKLLSVGIVFVLFVSVLFKNDLYSIET